MTVTAFSKTKRSAETLFHLYSMSCKDLLRFTSIIFKCILYILYHILNLFKQYDDTCTV